MKRIFITIAILFALCSLSCAQEVNKGIKSDTIKNNAQFDKRQDQYIMQEQQSTVKPIVEASVDPSLDTEDMKIYPKATEIDLGQPYLFSWRGGMLTGYQNSMSNMLYFRNMAGTMHTSNGDGLA